MPNPNLKNIEHLGLAVKDGNAAAKLYESLLGTSPYKQEAVESEGVRTVFFQLGETKIELLEPTAEDSPIGKFLEKRGEGLHHLAFGVADIHAEMTRLREAGFELLNDTPKEGADGKLICFLHPRSTHGVLVELCQDDPSQAVSGE